MSDQGHWFKLWISALHDPDLSNLPLEDFARWAILGTYIKAHGTEGMITLTPPARALCSLFHVPDFDALRAVIRRLPNVREEMHESPVSLVTVLSVSFCNWAKYQGDYSTERVRKFREMKRSKRRGEETRREQDERVVPQAPPDAALGNAQTSFTPMNGPEPVQFHTPAVILNALRRAPKLGTAAKLKTPEFWQAELRANPGVDYVGEILKAEAWLTSHPERPVKKFQAFLHNWLARADRPEA